jgi:hypothetical protein
MKHPPRRGRPRIDPLGEPVRVSLTVTAYQYDYLYAASKREDVSVPEVIRRHLRPIKRHK